MDSPRNKQPAAQQTQDEKGREIFRILALYEERRTVSPKHHFGLMFLCERGLIEVEEDGTGEIKAIATRKGALVLKRRRRKFEPLHKLGLD